VTNLTVPAALEILPVAMLALRQTRGGIVVHVVPMRKVVDEIILVDSTPSVITRSLSDAVSSYALVVTVVTFALTPIARQAIRQVCFKGYAGPKGQCPSQLTKWGCVSLATLHSIDRVTDRKSTMRLFIEIDVHANLTTADHGVTISPVQSATTVEHIPHKGALVWVWLTHTVGFLTSSINAVLVAVTIS
jgi:hypothetical protein